MAMELWDSGGFLACQLAILIMEKKQLNAELIEKLDRDIQTHEKKGSQPADRLAHGKSTHKRQKTAGND